MSNNLYLADITKRLRNLKKTAEKALAQVSDQDLFHTLGDESNSIAVVMKHMAGNMRSRWRDFLTSDGEKPDRHRDTEFELGDGDTKKALFERWEAGWKQALDTIEALEESDLTKTVYLRGHAHLVLAAVNREFSHYAYHVGQIVLLARHRAGKRWQPLTIPKGKTEEFLASLEKAPRNGSA